MISVISTIWEFFLEHFWAIVAIGGIFIYGKSFYRKYIFDPLAGGNGKIQMDELAKGVVVAIIIWAVQRDGYRTHEWAYFNDAFYAALIAGLFAIAAIKPIASVLKLNKQNGTQKTDTDTVSDSDSDTGDRSGSGTSLPKA